VLTGSLKLEVPIAERFMKDTVAQAAVKKGVAAAAGVRESDVSMLLSMDRRLLEKRRLADLVNMEYFIAVSPMSHISAGAVLSNLNSKTEADITRLIQAEVTAVKGEDHKVTLKSRTMVKLVEEKTEVVSRSIGAAVGSVPMFIVAFSLLQFAMEFRKTSY